MDPVIDEVDRLTGHVISIRDITDRTTSEAALNRSLETTRLQAEMLRNAPMPVVYHDLDLTVRMANSAYLDAIGLTEEQLVGRK